MPIWTLPLLAIGFVLAALLSLFWPKREVGLNTLEAEDTMAHWDHDIEEDLS